MKKSSIIKFTRKCLKLGYKEQVCRDAWIFGKTPDTEIKKLYTECFKGEKIFISSNLHEKKNKTLKHKKIPEKVTKKMMLKALGPRFNSAL
jgi:hypothetical protein